MYIVSPEYLAFKGKPVIFQAALKVHWLAWGRFHHVCVPRRKGTISIFFVCSATGRKADTFGTKE